MPNFHRDSDQSLSFKSLPNSSANYTFFHPHDNEDPKQLSPRKRGLSDSPINTPLNGCEYNGLNSFSIHSEKFSSNHF